jgi:hypothetical protein
VISSQSSSTFTNLPTLIVGFFVALSLLRCGSDVGRWHGARFGNVCLRSDHYRIPSQSSVALQAPHCVQWIKRPCTWSSSACSRTVPQFPHRKSMVCELAMRTGGAFTAFSMPLASTTLNARRGFCMVAFLQVLARIFAPMKKALLQQKQSEAICRWKCSTRRLLGSLPYLMDFDARYRSRASVL